MKMDIKDLTGVHREKCIFLNEKMRIRRTKNNCVTASTDHSQNLINGKSVESVLNSERERKSESGSVSDFPFFPLCISLSLYLSVFGLNVMY